MRFHRGYAVTAAALFVVEVLIALFMHDRWVRPHGGDVLAVMLVYAALLALFPMPRWAAALAALCIAFAIEFGQLVGVLDRVGLGDNALARTVFGHGYDRIDLIAYAIGGLAAWAIDTTWPRRAVAAH